MEALITFPSISLSKEKIFLSVLITIALIGGAYAFPLSYLTNSNELIGLCLLPFVISIQNNRRFNYLYLLLFISFGFGAWMYSVRMFYFFSLAFYMLWLVELVLGKVNILTIFLLIFMSPFFFQISVILGFPIRLQLSEMAGTLLQCVGLNIQIDGNMMQLSGATFTVDEACMGLNMLAISMLMGIFILAYTSRIAKKTLRLKHITTYFVIGFLLNIVSNLLRIILLVLFKIAPENPMHEIIGLLCLIFYILIPLYLLGKWLVFNYGHKPAISNKNITIITPIGKGVLLLAALSLMFIGIHIDHKRSQPDVVAHAKINAPAYVITQMEDGVTKLVNHSTLVYVKPIPEFFSGEHTPLICWKGSGYTFKNTLKANISGHEIYYGQLIKNNEALYTAWWYDNGSVQTIDQFDWRLRMMRGEENFSLINVSASDENTLLNTIHSIFNNRTLILEN